jgi:hypothetical protein
METTTNADLIRRAMAGYFKAGNTKQPSTASAVQTVNERSYVVLRSAGDILAVYRVRTDGVLKGLKRWPAALEKSGGAA